MSRIRVTSPAVVAQMAAVNHVPARIGAGVASVLLDGVVYFWAA